MTHPYYNFFFEDFTIPTKVLVHLCHDSFLCVPDVCHTSLILSFFL